MKLKELWWRMVLLGVCAVAVGYMCDLTWSGLSTDTWITFTPVTMVPVILLGRGITIAILSGGFLLWNVGVSNGGNTLPMRSVSLLGLITMGSLLWFAGGWGAGAQYQGIEYVHHWAWVNGCVCLLMWGAALWALWTPSWAKTVVFYCALFVWPVWCGFPWLGELL